MVKKKNPPPKTSPSRKKSTAKKATSKGEIGNAIVEKSSDRLSRRHRDNSATLLSDIRGFIVEARRQTAQVVNTALTLTYWQVGTRIRTDILQNERAGYGEEIMQTLSARLVPEFGRGYSTKSLRHMVRFAEIYPTLPIVSALSRQLAWSHFLEVLYLKDELAREFYIEMCRLERWSVRTLRAKIDGMLYERTAISKKPKALVAKELAELRDSDLLTPDLIFRDPYFLDFLGLKDAYSESDLENAILRELELFLLELGVGFAFVARQYRMSIDGEDFYLDLLLYHRRLRRLVAVDLKLGKFRAADKGQMELYLRWLEKHAMEEGEEPPLGLILCASKSDEQVELLQVSKSGIRVAEYLIDMPSRELLQQKLHEVVRSAQAHLATYHTHSAEEK